jgi:hypothetical protein
MKMKDVCSPRTKKDGSTYWHRVGTAFHKDDGKIGLVFDSLPLPGQDGRVNVQLFDRKPKDGEAEPKKPTMAGGGDMDDEIPF